ncbi:endo-1,4-beta-xylanase [Novosphingobium endophyticum]|uniref:Endo-1,4-beta-xylanase n=1 Tax=Novosphingobium endophyticum TaxID=1955250 RepID=A0A916X6A2_9SPHN|nr:alpha/beta hydrolase [Novosphingobium endophyticum]GGC14776.1 endo-1,4-beta-xylanase [Novosphingobium endophyticum]
MKGLALALTLLVAAPVSAQPVVPASELPPSFNLTPAEKGAIALYPGVAPGSENSKVAEIWYRTDNGQRAVRNVTRPTITPFLPDPAKSTGAAVIVVPGGGFKMLAMDHEGWPVARWLIDHGIAAFVLKYRLNETPDNAEVFERELKARFRGALSGTGPLPELKEPRATLDALQALKLVRANAARWNVDPSRVGMIGFSAGAITTLNATLAPGSAPRPAFIGYIYGPMLPVTVPSDAPPMFAALALDDRLFGHQGLGIIESWQKAGRPVELHAYQKGDHGFGLGRAGTTSTLLMDEFLAWMNANGWLAKE